MEELRLQIVDMLNGSGLSLEQELFIIRDIYKDIQYTISLELSRLEKERQDGIIENVSENKLGELSE